jgi:hypothetical protein
MHPFWRNLFEVAAALGFILVGTLIVHLVMSWWSASAALLGLPLGLAFHTSRGHWLKTRRRKHDSVTAITEAMTV